MAKTVTQSLVDGLLKIGCTEVSSPSRKYRAFRSELGDRFYFVGRAGGLRANNSLKLSGSTSMERTMFRRKLISYGEVQ